MDTNRGTSSAPLLERNGIRAALWLILAIYIAVAPFPAITVLGPSYGHQPLLAFLLLAAGAVWAAIVTRKLHLTPDAVALLCLTLYAAASLAWAPASGEGARLLVYRAHVFLPAVLLAPLLVRLIRPDVRLLACVFLLALLIRVVGAVSEFRESPAARLVDPAEYNPTWLGAYIALGIMLSVWFATTARHAIVRWSAALLAAGLIVPLVFTQSRNALVALIFGGVVVIGIHLARTLPRIARLKVPRASLRWVRIGVLAAFLLGLGLAIVPQYVLNTPLTDLARIQMLLSAGSQGDVTAGRLAIWSHGIHIWSNPLFGDGYASFAPMFEQEFGRYRSAHNAYLGIGVELGLIGIFFWLLALAALLWRAHLSPGAHPVVAWMAWYLVFFGFGNDVLGYKHFWLTWLFATLLAWRSESGHAKRGASR